MQFNRNGLIVIAALGFIAFLGVGKYALNSGILGRPDNSVSAVPVSTNIQKFQISDVHG